MVDLCCLCFWVSCGFWSFALENDVACERRVGVSKVEVRGNSGPADLPTLSFDKVKGRWTALPELLQHNKNQCRNRKGAPGRGEPIQFSSSWLSKSICGTYVLLLENICGIHIWDPSMPSLRLILQKSLPSQSCIC